MSRRISSFLRTKCPRSRTKRTNMSFSQWRRKLERSRRRDNSTTTWPGSKRHLKGWRKGIMRFWNNSRKPKSRKKTSTMKFNKDKEVSRSLLRKRFSMRNKTARKLKKVSLSAKNPYQSRKKNLNSLRKRSQLNKKHYDKVKLSWRVYKSNWIPTEKNTKW